MKRCLVVVALLAACKDKKAPSAAPAAAPSAPSVELAEVTGVGAVEYHAEGPVLAATPQAITIDGTQVVALHDGAVDAADLDGGASGRKIMKVTTRLTELGGSTPTSTLALSFAPRLSYGLLLEVLFSAQQREAGWKRFALLVQGDHGQRALPISLPDRSSQPTIAGPTGTLQAGDAGEPPLGMIVSVTGTDVQLWSTTGLEGSIAAPKVSVPRDAAAKAIDAALREIVQRRWPAQRPEGSRAIILTAPPDTPVQTIAELIDAMRPTFPDVLLSMGFE